MFILANFKELPITLLSLLACLSELTKQLCLSPLNSFNAVSEHNLCSWLIFLQLYLDIPEIKSQKINSNSSSTKIPTLHPFNGPLSGTTQVSRYQKGKTNLDFTEARDSEWQWNPLGHMQVCTSLQADNHTSTPLLSFYRPDALPAAQPTASKHWR